MGKRGELFTSRLQKDKRTYFFNVHETTRGDLSLNIVESKTTDTEGKFARQSILIFEEDLDEFLEKMQGSIDAIRQEQIKRKLKGDYK